MHVPTRELLHQLLARPETKPQLSLNLRRSTRRIFITGHCTVKYAGGEKRQEKGRERNDYPRCCPHNSTVARVISAVNRATKLAACRTGRVIAGMRPTVTFSRFGTSGSFLLASFHSRASGEKRGRLFGDGIVFATDLAESINFDWFGETLRYTRFSKRFRVSVYTVYLGHVQCLLSLIVSAGLYNCFGSFNFNRLRCKFSGNVPAKFLRWVEKYWGTRVLVSFFSSWMAKC